MAWSGCALAQGGAQCKLAELLKLPVTMTGLRPLVSAKINGKDVRLSLDSGAFYSMISPASAAALHLRTRPAPFFVTGIGGRIKVSLATAEHVDLAGVPLHDVVFIVGGNDEVGDSIGLLGRNFLELGDIDFDLAQGMVRLMTAQDCGDTVLAYWAHAGDAYSVMDIDAPARLQLFESKHAKAAERYMEPITGKAFVNGVEVRVIFDTGAPTSYLTVKAADRAGIKLGSPEVKAAGYGGGVGRGQVANYLARVASFKIGDEEVRNTQLRLGDTSIGNTDADMLIGADFFLSHHIYVANSQHKLYFTYGGGPVFNLKAVVAASNRPTPAPSPGEPGEQPATSPEPATPTTPAAAATSPSAGSAATPAADASAAPPAPTALDPKIAEEADEHARRGTGFAARREFDQALPELDRACELAPDNPDYFYERGSIRAQTGDRSKAMADFDRALELKPDHVLALLGRGHLRIDKGDKAGAEADLDAANAALPKEDGLHFQLAEEYERDGRFQRSVEQYDLWLASHPRDANARLYGALSLRCRASAFGNIDLPRALENCDEALLHAARSSPFYAEVIGNRGLVRLRQENYSRSVSDLDDSLKITPRNARFLYARGIDKLRLQQTAQGEADIAQAKAISASIADPFETYGIKP